MKILQKIFCNLKLLWMLAIVLLALPQNIWAYIEPEMEGLEVTAMENGTFLVGSPTYFYDRILGAGGMHSESELWSPRKLRHRQLFNRWSQVPSWTPMAPSVWLKTGNELGDMIYQDVITESNRPDNRTPILEGGFRTPSIKGFWATARGFQDDHYSAYTMSTRKKWVDDEFAWFGENWPMFSTAYCGLGWSNDFVNASVLVGEEYLWLFSESSRWIPVHYKPRVEGRLDVANVEMTIAYEDAEYQNNAKKEKGNRKELNGNFRYGCDVNCQKGMFQLSAGMAFRAVDDSGTVYTHLDEDFVAWPFMELRVRPLRQITLDAMFGMNDRDFLVEDSLELAPSVPEKMGVIIGVKNISGSRLNPLADSEEYFEKDTISLTANGQMNLVEVYTSFADTIGNMALGGRASYWAEHGAETFEVDHYVEDGNMLYRHGDVSRINDWIYGITGMVWFGTWYGDLFNFKADAGFERISGKGSLFEVKPVEFFTGFNADWNLFRSFRISHALRYRSDSEWNLRSRNPLVVKGDWYWDATFEQKFEKQGLFLTGTIIHALAEEVLQTPNGSYDRIRFVCSVRKLF